MAEFLPEDCLIQVISFTSPRDVCRSSAVAGIFRDAAYSDVVWEKFLPLDYREIIARSVCPVEFSSKKELFDKLCSTPLLIDGGNKTIGIDKYTNKKCCMLGARELSITWSTNPLYWCWKSLPRSRFLEGVELVMVSWLEIRGKISNKMLSPNTTYIAYLVVQLARRAFGLGTVRPKVSVQVGECKIERRILMDYEERKRHELDSLHEGGGGGGGGESLRERGDGWLEVELGEFYNDGNMETEVIMEFREVEGVHLKGGLLVEGIELRPKY